MTEAEFDVLLKQALANGLEADLAAAWNADGPEISFSADHWVWQADFLSAPFAAAKGRKRKTRRLWTPRRTVRVALVAALVVIITLSAAWAIIPVIQNHWITQIEPVTFIATGESADYYHLFFDANAFGLKDYTWSEYTLPEFKRWSPTWLPKSHGIKLVEEIGRYLPEDGYSVQSYRVPNEKLQPLKEGQHYEYLTVSYQFLRDGLRCSLGFKGDFEYEIVQINNHPAYIIWDTNSALSGHRHLIWLGDDEQTVFHMSYRNDNPDNKNMLKIAKSFKKMR